MALDGRVQRPLSSPSRQLCQNVPPKLSVIGAAQGEVAVEDAVSAPGVCGIALSRQLPGNQLGRLDQDRRLLLFGPLWHSTSCCSS
jgi:hypothetical protein